MAAHHAPLSLGFSRQEHWSGLPFPPPMHESEKWTWRCSVMSDSQRSHRQQPTRLPPSMGFSRQEYWSGLPLPSQCMYQWFIPFGRWVVFHWMAISHFILLPVDEHLACFHYLNTTNKATMRASLVVQRLRILLAMQGIRVWSLVWEDPTCCGATKPVQHSWARALAAADHNYWAHVPQLRKPAHLEPVLHNMRSPCNQKPEHRNEEQPSLTATRESLLTAIKTHHSQ